MKEYHELTADKVLRLSIICLVFVIINAFIVRKEMRTRLRGEARFGRSKSLKWLSLFSIIGGLLHAMTRLLSRVDGVCYFTTELSDVIALTHPIIVGLHQLALLYHSFSRFKAPPGFAGLLMNQLNSQNVKMTKFKNISNFQISNIPINRVTESDTIKLPNYSIDDWF